MSYIIELLIENEQLVCELYKQFAKKFPKNKDFWEGIASDETKHIAFLKDTLNRNITFNEKSMSRSHIKNMISHLETLLIKAVKSSEFSQIDAVNEALNIENSMVEMKFFEPFRQHDGSMDERISIVEKDTRSHYERLKELRNRLTER
jgi:hypothetical protein